MKNVDFKEQEDFFVSNKNEFGNWSPSVPMPRNINTSNNEGAPTLSADGRSLVLLRARIKLVIMDQTEKVEVVVTYFCKENRR